MSRDPLGFVDGGNVYAYVGSDPINLIDPLGTAGGFWQNLTDFSAAFGDRLTFGGTAWLRRKLGVDDVVDKCSGWYLAGSIAGDLTAGYLMGAGLGRLLGAGARLPCRNSFTAGTPVHTPDGLVAIETLVPGDLVLARNDQTGELAYRPIDHVIVTADKQAYDLRLDRGGLVETIGVTSEHPLWVRGRGWTKAYRLAPGDQVFTDSGQWARVVSNAPGATRAYVYNLDVADDHTFFVGHVGAWVHNCALTLGRGGAAPVRAGQAGERAVRAVHAIGDKAKVAINGRNRIPDGVTTRAVSEVKNVKSLSYTRQLQDSADLAHLTGRRFDLYVRPGARLSGPLKQAVMSRAIRLRLIPF